MKEAAYYEKLDNGSVRCMLCPHRCSLRPGMTGVCRARRNIDGRLFSLNYGYAVSVALDPIEKATVPFPSRQPYTVSRHIRLQFQVQLVPELVHRSWGG